MNLDTYHTIGKLQQAIGNIKKTRKILRDIDGFGYGSIDDSLSNAGRSLEMELDEMLSLERSV